MKLNIAVVLAAGSGSRMGAGVPKQYCHFSDSADSVMLLVVLRKFILHDAIDYVLPVIDREHVKLYEEMVEGNDLLEEGGSGSKLLPPIYGGESRSSSSMKAVLYLEDFIVNELGGDLEMCNIIVHDAARPFVTNDLIAGVVAQLDASDVVDVALSMVDSVKVRCTFASLDRGSLYATQTPQGFAAHIIVSAYKKLGKRILAGGGGGSGEVLVSDYSDYSDDVALCLDNCGAQEVVCVAIDGDRNNFKVTYDSDMEYASYLYRKHKL